MRVLSASRKAWWRSTYKGRIYRLACGEIVCDDALSFLNALQDECADIVFLDPPFNLGKKYGSRKGCADRLTDEKYFKYMTQVLWRCAEVLKPGGALYLYHIPRWAIRFASVLDSELDFHHWIAICMKNGSARGKSLVPAHYALLLYTKGEPVHFRRPLIDPATCRRCGATIKDYGGYKRYVEKGVNLSDFWEDISPVRHKKFKHRSSNELHPKMLARVVEISGVRGGLVVDPFAGTGTTLCAAREAGMCFVACDNAQEFLDVMANRLEG